MENWSFDKISSHIKDLVETNGGEIVSAHYDKNSNIIFLLECSKQHQWKKIMPSNYPNTWCSQCIEEDGIRERIHEIVSLKEGLVLSEIFPKTSKKVKLQCKLGHTWETIPNNIVIGRWCPDCAGNKKLTLDDLKNMATQKGGKCLSETYKGSLKKHKWECKKGHVWEMQPNNMRYKDAWCPYCAGYKKVKLSENDKLILKYQKLVSKKDGVLLSKTYPGLTEDMVWLCKYAHVWKDSAANIENGSWCPICEQTSK